MFNRIINYLDKYKMLSLFQFGLRLKTSTYMPVLNLIEKIISNFENRQIQYAFFLGLTKAFDVIDQENLLKKLSYYEFNGSSTPDFLITSLIVHNTLYY